MLGRKCAAITFAVAVSLASALGVKAIPSVTPHQNDGATIRWEEDGLKDGSSSHNHRSARSFGGDSSHQSQYLSREPYTAMAAWDDRTLRWDREGLFSFGHGFIDEAAGTDHVPRYFFSNAEGVWPEWAKQRVREAFQAWGGIASDEPGLVTGVAFQETSDGASAEITIFWADLPQEDGLPLGEWSLPWQELRFNTRVPWYEPKNPAGITAGECHFFSVALHEIGHVLGLDHQDDPDDLMEGIATADPCAPGGYYFMAPDAGSIEGVRDLYSIPKGPAEGPSPTPTAGPAPRPTATPTRGGTPAPAPHPGVATITLPPPGEAEPLYEGCNFIGLTFPDGTPAQTVAQAINPAAALRAIWRHNAAEQRWEGFSPAAAQASDLQTVNFLDPVSICVTAALPPGPPPPTPTPAATPLPAATPTSGPPAEPIGGATYRGKTSQDTPWRFGVSSEGGSVTWIEAEVAAHCTGGPPGGFTEFVYRLRGLVPSPIPIRNGRFSYREPGLEISGRFTSATTAEGEVHLWEEDTHTYPGYTLSCDSGTVTWTASAR